MTAARRVTTGNTQVREIFAAVLEDVGFPPLELGGLELVVLGSADIYSAETAYEAAAAAAGIAGTAEIAGHC